MKVRAFAILLASILVAAVPAAQLPPVSWTCPMHPDVLEDKKAKCSICGMDLEPVRLVTMYTCPVHAVIEQSKPGKCRICARELVQMTAALTFTCSDNREVNQIELGKCPDGSAMVPRYTQRAHGDHNPKHGGTFFMAPDNWHHIEGTYPAPGRFRAYVYDDYSKPLSAPDARKVRGRVVTKEVFDQKTGTTRELASAPLVLARSGAFFEARLESLTLPAKLTVKISFRSDDKESRFDFAFQAQSRDLSTRVAPPASASAPKAASASAQSSTADKTADKPTAPDQLLSELNVRRAEVETMLKNGNYAAIFVPALQAKDAALAIQTRHDGAGGIDRDALEANVKQIVLAAYQLDNYGDIGDGPKVQEAFATFNAAISALDSLVAGRR